MTLGLRGTLPSVSDMAAIKIRASKDKSAQRRKFIKKLYTMAYFYGMGR